MASRTSKGQKAKKAKDPTVVKGTVTVRDCMTWHYQDGYKPEGDENQQQNREFRLPKKPDIGRAKSRGYEMPVDAGYQVRGDDGRVIDALRGWPQNQQYDEQPNGDYLQTEGDQKTGGEGGEKKGDPWMGDLISHKFMMDAIRKRQQEEREAARRAARKGHKGGPGHADIKANRTSQLRAIALAEKVEVSPHELWQMSKFKKNARPHLSTVNRRAKDKNRKNLGDDDNGNDTSGGGDPCTCYDNNQAMFDEGRPNSNTEPQPEYGHLDNNLDYYYRHEDDENKYLHAV